MGAHDLLLGPEERAPGTAARAHAWCRATANHLSLFLALVAYTVMGGLVFRQLEYPAEVGRLTELARVVRDGREELLSVLNCSASAPSPVTVEEALSHYEAAVQKAAAGGLLVPFAHDDDPTSLAKWTNLQAVFFASTVLTTIGYGNVTPTTLGGRLFCILFALVGIPLTLSVLADLGMLLASRLPSPPEARGLPSSLATAAAATSILIAYIAVGGALVCLVEPDWSFFEGFYFCFVTMTTIGFGDLVPSTPQYMLLCTLYIMLGLSLTSTIIELVRQQYSQSWQHLQALAETLQLDGQMQADLRRIVSLHRRRGRGQNMAQAVQQLSLELNRQRARQRIVNIIVMYESSV